MRTMLSLKQVKENLDPIISTTDELQRQPQFIVEVMDEVLGRPSEEKDQLDFDFKMQSSTGSQIISYKGKDIGVISLRHEFSGDITQNNITLIWEFKPIQQ